MMNFRKIFRRFFILSAVLLSLGLISSYLFARIYEDEIKGFVISKIEKEFSAQINVNKIKLNLWKRFPNVTLHFENITITDVHLKENPPLLIAKSLYFQFNIREIIKKKYVLRKVEISEGKIDLLIYKGGLNNFDIAGETDSTESSMFLNIENLRLKNMVVAYENQSTSQYFELLAEKIDLPLSIYDELMQARINGKGMVNSFQTEGVELLQQADMEIDANFDYNLKNQVMNIAKSTINISNYPLTIDGVISLDNNALSTKIKISSNLTMRQVERIIPKEYKREFDLNPDKGSVDLSVEVDGRIGGNLMPKISGTFTLSQVDISLMNNQLNLRDLNFVGSFDNGKFRNAESMKLELKNISAVVNGEHAQAHLILSNLQNPHLKGQLQSSVNLNQYAALLGSDIIDNISGRLEFGLKFNGLVEDFKSINSLSKAQIDGSYKLTDGSLKLKNQNTSYKNVHLEGRISSFDLLINTADLVLNNSRISGKISLSNYLALLDQSSRTSVALNAQLKSTTISLEEILDALTFESEQPAQASNLQWIANIDFDIDKFIYNQLIIQKAKGEFSYFDGSWDINRTSFLFEEGQFVGDLMSRPFQKNQTAFTLSGEYKSLNISKVFKSFGNFDQTVITSDNISGKMSGTLNFRFTFDANGKFQEESLKGNADFTIANGQLKNVAQLNALSKFTRIDDFSEINFKTLTNSITFENQKIIIPKMFVESDKINFEAYGTHTFANSYEYHLSVEVSQLMGRKVEKTKETEFGIVEDPQRGKTKLFLQIIGEGENFKVKYDRREASEKVSNDLKNERQELKEALKNEFVNETNDSIRKARKAAKEAEIEKLKRQEKGEFIIEWNDEDENIENF